MSRKKLSIFVCVDQDLNIHIGLMVRKHKIMLAFVTFPAFVFGVVVSIEVELK